MKALAVAAILFGLMVVAVPMRVFAASLNDVCTQAGGSAASSTFCQDQTSTNPAAGSGGIINKVAAVIAIVGGIAAVIIIIIGGLQYVLSNGDSNKVNSAKNMILYALLGLAIIALAEVIVSFAVSKL